MEHLLEELLQRWEQAFDELETLSAYRAQVKTIQYANSRRYDLSNFDWNSFSSNGPISTDKKEIAGRPYEYGFNADGLPCYVRFGHDHNQVEWEGFYTYSNTLVEYVEFCLTTGIPSALQRVEYRNSQKTSLQLLWLNRRGSGYSRSLMSKEEIVDKIKNDGYSLISTVTRYTYDPTGNTKKAFNIHISPGFGKFTSCDDYTYDEDQNLDTIQRFFEQGTHELIYCRIPENTDPQSLINNLAEKLAYSIAKNLAEHHVEQPVALLELNYQLLYTHFPRLIPQSARQVTERLASKMLTSYFDELIQLDPAPFQRSIAQLDQIIDEGGDSNLGSKMLKKTAALLTRNKLFGLVEVTDDFGTYAIDWTCVDESFEELLQECGFTEELVDIWRQKGMIVGF